MSVDTSKGSLILPRTINAIVLDGRQSKVIVTDYSFGSSKLLYSTASIFFAGKIGSRDTLFLFGDSNQSHEAGLSLSGVPGIRTAASNVKFATDNNGLTTVTFLPDIKGLITVWESDSQLVFFSDPVTAATFWAPVIPGSSELAHYWQLGSNDTVLVGGPYLVRNATISNSVLALTGDLNTSVALTVIAPSQVMFVSWNGAIVVPDASAKHNSSVFTGRLGKKFSTNSIIVPSLDNWKFADSLPEIQHDFSDESWINADHTTTNIITRPLYGDGRILYGAL